MKCKRMRKSIANMRAEQLRVYFFLIKYIRSDGRARSNLSLGKPRNMNLIKSPYANLKIINE